MAKEQKQLFPVSMRKRWYCLSRVFLSQYAEMLAAVHFLSVLPAPGQTQLFEREKAAPRLVVGGAYFPLVGLLLAGILWLLLLIFAPLISQLALAALLVVGLAILTGGLHLDGLMDSCDGLFGGRTRERKLEIMRDSRVGSFGVLGGGCVLLLKFAFLASIKAHTLPLTLLVVLPSARWTMVLVLRVFPSARLSGLGAAFRQAVTMQQLLSAGISALAIALIAGRSIGLIVWITVSVVALLLGLWITRSIGGLTGDSYGAIEEIVEVVALLVLLILRV